MRRAAAALAAVALAGCGTGDAADRPTLTVQAAASLAAPLTACTRQFRPATVRLALGGSDELAAQIRRGAAGDLYAAANATLPAQLAAEGLVDRPRAFAGNELVLALPARGGRVAGLADLERRRDARLAVGAPSVPVGAYARAALDRLPAARRRAILARVRTEEPDVRGVLAKLRQGVVDAAFAYRTDVRATGDDLRAVALPAGMAPWVAYAAAVVAGTRHPDEARALLADLRGGACARALRAAGFRPPAGGG